MKRITDRCSMIATCIAQRVRYGLPKMDGPVDRQALFVVDGVGGFQIAPVVIRKVLRELTEPIGTVVVPWQFGLMGEIWTDLMWLRRNKVMGCRLARELLAFKRAHPQTPIHIIAYSGGAGIATFACEFLRGRQIVETLIIGCPALSPGYDFTSALQAVQRAYALVSHRDSWVLGWGTRIFGTTDRRFSASGGCVGFGLPKAEGARKAYERLRQIEWSPDLGAVGNHGGHAGWMNSAFLRRHLIPLLRGQPRLTTCEIEPKCSA